jgi:hypothetical protein
MLRSKDILILDKSRLIDLLGSKIGAYKGLESYSFFSPGIDDIISNNYDLYPKKAMLCRSDSELALYLVKNGILLRPFRKLSELIDWQITDDEKFIRQVSDLLFSINYNSNYFLLMREKLDQCDGNRKLLVEKLLKDILINGNRKHKRKNILRKFIFPVFRQDNKPAQKDSPIVD